MHGLGFKADLSQEDGSMMAMVQPHVATHFACGSGIHAPLRSLKN